MDVLLLTIYFLVVFYVLYQMALSLEDKLEDKAIIKLKSDFWQEQTQAQIDGQPGTKHIRAQMVELMLGKDKKFKQTMLALSVAPQSRKAVGPDGEPAAARNILLNVMPVGKRPLNQIPNLTVSIDNGTEDTQVYIDWDASSLELMGESRRVIRNAPNMPIDLSQPQIYSVVNPGKSLVSVINAEQNYARNPETNQVIQAVPLIDLKDQVGFLPSDPTSGEQKARSLYNLDLMVGLKRRNEPPSELINLLLPFAFTLELAPDQIAFPLLRQFLKHYGRRSRPPQRSIWFWGVEFKR